MLQKSYCKILNKSDMLSAINCHENYPIYIRLLHPASH